MNIALLNELNFYVIVPGTITTLTVNSIAFAVNGEDIGDITMSTTTVDTSTGLVSISLSEDIDYDHLTFTLNITKNGTAETIVGTAYDVDRILLYTSVRLLNLYGKACNDTITLNKILLLDFKYNMFQLALENSRYYDILVYLPELLRSIEIATTRSTSYVTSNDYVY